MARFFTDHGQTSEEMNQLNQLCYFHFFSVHVFFASKGSFQNLFTLIIAGVKCRVVAVKSQYSANYSFLVLWNH